MRLLLRLTLGTGVALIAAQASAAQLKFTNKTGGKVCLASDLVPNDAAKWRQVSGWTCLDDGASTDALPFVGQAYVTVYTALDATPVNYVDAHDLGLTKDVIPLPKTINDKNFGLHYWNDPNTGSWNYAVDDGTGHYADPYVGQAGDEWDAGLDHVGFKNVTAWIFDDSTMTNPSQEVTLKP